MAGRACGRASAIRVDSADVVTHRDLHHAPAVLAFDDLFFPGIQSKYDLGHSYSRSQSILAASRWLAPAVVRSRVVAATRSEEHTPELQSLMGISYAVFCLKKQKHSSLH